jgi:hypothetical protein
MNAADGALWGNGKAGDDEAGYYEKGDRVGILLGLGHGSLRFFRNGAQNGPGYVAGSVAGPVVAAAVQMYPQNASERATTAKCTAARVGHFGIDDTENEGEGVLRWLKGFVG